MTGVLMEVAETLNFVVLNDGATTFAKGQQESTVDVSLCSPNIVNRLLWTASGDPMGSDHHPVFIHINGKPESISRRPRWKYNQADWYHFQELVDSEVSNIAPNNIFLAQSIKRRYFLFLEQLQIQVEDPYHGGLQTSINWSKREEKPSEPLNVYQKVIRQNLNS